MHRAAAFLLLVLVAALAVSPGEVRAQRLGLANMVLDNQGGRAKLRFGVDVRDPKLVEAVDQALRQGQVLALECKARLSLKRDYLWNREVAQATLLSPLILHDGGPYEVVLHRGGEERVRGRDLGLLMREAWNKLSIDLGAWSVLERGKAYAVTLEIRMVRQDVGDWLQGALFFWGFDPVGPVTYQLDFSY
ncbi:hypothetical protein NNJEOMEG_02855 [Fundidesulfovibrio magnetotacticus]|uniref:DUF4390 domain-containing protein n=1 Tax=Fundidesulfovibrio magnetotacticus TaxID=2730080 RepID=A0A6V8LZD7_9BACT|nr:DUF4390 domain-containing protein [Fundidesulfovibrio magnetotacticus]GFK95007.1 hypothetical protein NNJEOMEG_02855 [Fundidesulfovibrio magnetotacticus]